MPVASPTSTVVSNITPYYRYGWTPLHRAAQSNYKDVARALLEHGAEANRIDLS
jgi:hypothetical protein